MQSSPLSTAEAGGGSVDGVTSSEPLVPIIVGVVVVVGVCTPLLALVGSGLICFKIKLLKNYNMKLNSRDEGELAVQG